MIKSEWREFWEGVETAAFEYDCIVYKIEADGGWRVLVLKDEDDPNEKTPEAILKNGVLVASARYGFRGDEETHSHYHQMLKIQWNTTNPVPFGMSKTTTIYISPVPSAVFAILYA